MANRLINYINNKIAKLKGENLKQLYNEEAGKELRDIIVKGLNNTNFPVIPLTKNGSIILYNINNFFITKDGSVFGSATAETPLLFQSRPVRRALKNRLNQGK